MIRKNIFRTTTGLFELLGMTLLLSCHATAADWSPIKCVPVDLPTEALFQVVQPVDDFEAADVGWQAVSGGQNTRCEIVRDTHIAHQGQAALRVDYDFVGKADYEYLQINVPLEIPQAGNAFGFWLKHDGVAFPTRLRMVDAGGETHQVELYSGKQSGWQFVAGSLDGPSTSWGGDDNRRRDYPCRLVGICLDRPRSGYVGQGSLWIDDVALLHQRDLPRTMKVTVGELPYGHLFAVGQSVSIRVSGDGDRIDWMVKDFWGDRLAQGQGAASGTEIHFSLSRPGYFACRMDLYRGGELAEARKFLLRSARRRGRTVAQRFCGSLQPLRPE